MVAIAKNKIGSRKFLEQLFKKPIDNTQLKNENLHMKSILIVLLSLMLAMAYTTIGCRLKQPRGTAPMRVSHQILEASAPPNIVYILADDMGYGDVSSLNPDSKINTPHIDGLAHAGMTFTDAHASSSVCTPSRYGILTGRYCWRTRLTKGVQNGYGPPLIEEGRMTVASLLKSKGYNTACIGKWHLGSELPSMDGKPASGSNTDWKGVIRQGPISNGFDYFFGILGSLDMPPYIYIENDRFMGECTTNKVFGQIMPRRGAAEASFVAEETLPEITKRTINYINQQDDSKPFFIYMSLTAPHTPLVPTKDFQGKTTLGPYGDFCVQVDHTVGQVMSALKQKKMDENTLVIFTSDNGFAPYVNVKELESKGHFPSYVYRGFKFDIFEGGHRVPFIASWPKKIKKSSQSHQMICLSDLLNTSAAILGVELPDSAGEDSYNILPLMEGKERPVRQSIVHHAVDGSLSIRQNYWKLELCPGSGGYADPTNQDAKSKGLPNVQLYDLSNDVRETKNVQSMHPAKVKALTAILDGFKKSGRSRPVSGRAL
jgi:arylsulfatase A